VSLVADLNAYRPAADPLLDTRTQLLGELRELADELQFLRTQELPNDVARSHDAYVSAVLQGLFAEVGLPDVRLVASLHQARWSATARKGERQLRVGGCGPSARRCPDEETAPNPQGPEHSPAYLIFWRAGQPSARLVASVRGGTWPDAQQPHPRSVVGGCRHVLESAVLARKGVTRLNQSSINYVESGRSVVPTKHEQEDVLVTRIHESVQVATLEHRQMTSSQGAHFETAVALGHLAPVADDHEALAVEHEEHLLVVAVAVQPDAAVGT
jgi:hypothetical protein